MRQPGRCLGRDDYLLRLRKIEGQVRGLQRMVERGEDCIDVLTQVAAVTAALHGVAVGLVDEHLRRRVMEAASVGEPERDATLHEAVRAVERLVRL